APEPTTTKSAEVGGASAAWTAGPPGADPLSRGADWVSSAVRGIRSAGKASAALSRSRRFMLAASRGASERLHEPNQCTLVLVAEARFLGEIRRSEIVTLVDDEVLAFADGEHVVRQIAEDGRQVAVRFQLLSGSSDEHEDLLPMLFAFGRRQFGSENAHVRDQPNRHSLRKRAHMDR